METTLPDGRKTRLPRIPLRIGSYDFGLRRDPLATREGSEDLLYSLGLEQNQIEALNKKGVIGPF